MGWACPTITALSRRDAAAALGFLHAQDRFFQMDLQRRQAAGELSALVGGARARARSIGACPPLSAHQPEGAGAHSARAIARLLEAYADGVNAGLAALRSAPIEYHVLRAAPEPWKPEDTLLTGFAMFNTLQGRQATFRGNIRHARGHGAGADYDFLTARGSEWDAPLNGATFPASAGAVERT